MKEVHFYKNPHEGLICEKKALLYTVQTNTGAFTPVFVCRFPSPSYRNLIIIIFFFLQTTLCVT